MLVKIINGTYGHRAALPNGKKSPYLTRVTPSHPPIDVEDAEGERLIGLGVAERVGTVESLPNETEALNDEKTAISDVSPAVVYSTDMTQSELRKAMDAAGLRHDNRMTKKQMVEALNSMDDFPELDVEDVVD